MSERGILMHARSVNGILDGRKTQTRRIIKRQPTRVVTDWSWDAEEGDKVIYRGWPHYLRPSNGRDKRAAGILTPVQVKCPYGKPGDRLWVRETWAMATTISSTDKASEGKRNVIYRASVDAVDDEIIKGNWRPSIYMPRWASRITLEITDIRVERVQDISPEDIRAEGVDITAIYHRGTPPNIAEEINSAVLRREWERLWDDTNGKGAWERNDWVWVVEFKRVNA